MGMGEDMLHSSCEIIIMPLVCNHNTKGGSLSFLCDHQIMLFGYSQVYMIIKTVSSVMNSVYTWVPIYLEPQSLIWLLGTKQPSKCVCYKAHIPPSKPQHRLLDYYGTI